MSIHSTLENSSVKEKPGKKSLVISLIIIGIVACFIGVVKSRKDSEKALVQNRIVAAKYCALGVVLPPSFKEKVDLALLEEDAAAGNDNAQRSLNLYQHRIAINDAVKLGKSTPDKLNEKIDLDILFSDAEAGNSNAAFQLKLMKERELIKRYIMFGEQVSKDQLVKVDLELLQNDADAGNSIVAEKMKLIENRTKAESLCVLGAPFDYTFYDQVDRGLLEKDGKAGYEQALEIIKLADNRIEANERTIDNRAFEKNFYEHVDKELHQKDADAGNADMQYIYSRLHDKESGIFDDPDVMVKYCMKAANQNHAKAQSNLSYYYSKGIGVARDEEKAFQLAEKSAMNGYRNGMHNLGYHYEIGSGVEKNEKKALYWYTQASELGFGDSHYKLGMFYCYGRKTIKKDVAKGLEYFQKGVDQLSGPSIRALEKYAKEEMPQNKRNATLLELYRTLAHQDFGTSMAEYGRMLVRGQGVEKNIPEGIKLIKKSADKDNRLGLAILAGMYSQGKGVKRNFPEAVRIYKSLAEKYKDKASIYNLGDIYGEGKEGVEKSAELSFKYFKMGYDHGYTGFTVRLARLYRDGEGTEKDLVEAVDIMKKLAERDSAACNELGLWYLNGEHIDKNPDLAMHYFIRGANLGNISATANLATRYLIGDIVPVNETEALRLFRIGLKAGNAYSTYYVAKIHEEGTCGIEKNIPWAIKLYTKSANKGFKFAKDALKRLNVKP